MIGIITYEESKKWINRIELQIHFSDTGAKKIDEECLKYVIKILDEIPNSSKAEMKVSLKDDEIKMSCSSFVNEKQNFKDFIKDNIEKTEVLIISWETKKKG